MPDTTRTSQLNALGLVLKDINQDAAKEKCFFCGCEMEVQSAEGLHKIWRCEGPMHHVFISDLVGLIFVGIDVGCWARGIESPDDFQRVRGVEKNG